MSLNKAVELLNSGNQLDFPISGSDVKEFSFFDESKERIFYIYDMAEGSTMKEGGLVGIKNIIKSIDSFTGDKIRTTILFLNDGKELTMLSDINYNLVISVFEDL